MRCIIERVRVCIVLHNLLIGSTFPQEWIEPNEENLDYDFFANADDSDNEEDDDISKNVNDRCEAIMCYMLN
jgi:hypothetical protein